MCAKRVPRRSCVSLCIGVRSAACVVRTCAVSSASASRQVHMASSEAHHATGWAAGIIAAALASKAAGMDYLSCALALLGGVVGATAPDWLEVAWWTSKRKLWITHRTLTHW